MKMKVKIFTIITLITITIFLLSACGTADKVIVSKSEGDVTIKLTNSDGYLKKGKNDFNLHVLKGKDHLAVSADKVKFYLKMEAMGNMPHMQHDAKFSGSPKPGILSGNIELQMGQSWDGVVSITGKDGNETTINFTTMVKE